MSSQPLRLRPDPPSSRPVLARSRLGWVAWSVLALLGARGTVRHLSDVVRGGPLATPLTGHPTWLTLAYFDWLVELAPETELARRLDALLPKGVAVAHVGSLWTFGRLRYGLYPRPVIDQSSSDLAPAAGASPGNPSLLGLVPGAITIWVEILPGSAASVVRSGEVETLGRVRAYYVVRRRPRRAPSGEAAR